MRRRRYPCTGCGHATEKHQWFGEEGREYVACVVCVGLPPAAWQCRGYPPQHVPEATR